jgi:hypothetical protein
MRLGECRERLRDQRGALAAFEKALESDPSRRPLRVALVDRYGDDPAADAIVRAHHMVLLADEPLRAASLRAVARIDARLGRGDGGRRFVELLAVAGAISDAERRALSSPPADEDPHTGTLDEADHAALAHPEALPLSQVFAALWEGSSGRTPDLAALGVHADDRVSPVAPTDLARTYALAARALGNRRTGLYLRRHGGTAELTVVAHPPTALVVSPQLTQGRALADVRFVVGRALELARPEYVLAAALPPAEFTRLFSAILRAFHPRHARLRPGQPTQRGGDDEAAAWRRALPYKVARRLGELFRQLAETEFSTARWRRAVQHTANRAGLLVAGDMMAAARVLNSEGDPEAVLELARFAVSDAYAALRAKLTR